MQHKAEGDEVTEQVLNGMTALVGIAARSLGAVLNEVTLPQYRVLVLVHGRGPMTMGELATSLDVNPSTVTRVCDVLVDKKLISRRPTVDNRRGVCAHLTARGRKLVDQVMRRRRVLIDHALAPMSSEAKRSLARGLEEFAVIAGEVRDDAWTLGWSSVRAADGAA